MLPRDSAHIVLEVHLGFTYSSVLVLHDDDHGEIYFNMVMMIKIKLLNLDSADVETSLAERHVQWFKVGHFYICLFILMDLDIGNDTRIQNPNSLEI